MPIFRAVITDMKGKVVAVKLVEGKSIKALERLPKTRFVGPGRKVLGFIPTRIKGRLTRAKALRARRFG